VANPKRQQAAKKRYYTRHPDKAKQHRKSAHDNEYRNHRERVILRVNASRAKRLGVQGIVTPQDWLAQFKKQGYACAICGTTKGPWEWDHIIPLDWTEYTSNMPENGQVLCEFDNRSKHVKAYSGIIFTWKKEHREAFKNRTANPNALTLA
jgi:hypothetical protein